MGVGQAQIEFLKRQELKPSDTLLDIGCGDLRGGLHIIDYLNEGNYTGMDISEEAIKSGWKNLQEEDFLDKYPTLIVNNNLKLSRFDNHEFDVIFANSVLTHLPKENIAELFDNVGRVLAEDGYCYLSYNNNDKEEKIMTNRVSKSNVYKYPFDTLRDLSSRYDLEAERDRYDEHPTEQMEMLVVSQKNTQQ